MRIRRSLAALTAVATGVASAAVLLVAADPAAAASPTRILNTGSSGGLPNWLEAQSSADDADQNGRWTDVTFLAEHVAGRRITQVQVTTIGNGTQTFNVTPQVYPGPPTNAMETSRVSLRFDPGRAGGYSCPIAGGATRRHTNLTQTFRVIDSAGEQSAAVSFGNFAQVEKDDCLGRTDFIDIHNQSQSATTATPGTNVNFTFQGDDDDSSGENDHFDRYRVRSRNLSTGQIINHAEQNPGGNNDNDTLTFGTSFPSRGRWVVEIEPGGEDGYNQSGTWWRLGAVDVNEAAAPTASIGFTATPTSALFSSTPPSVNAGIPVNAVLSASDPSGNVQIAEWDATNDGTFERLEYTVPALSSTSHPNLTTAELAQSIATATHGTRNVRARVTDNGAIDASDDIARQNTASSSLRVNAIPVANGQTVSATEDTPVNFTLVGTDADNQPQALAYTLVSSPGVGSLNCSAMPACTFTPPANFNGSTSFQFRVADGPVSAGANAGQAWSNSVAATVTINVAGVNDPPTANPQNRTTAEDTPLSVTLTGSDIETPTASLGFTIVDAPDHGTLTPPSGAGATRLYTPAANFHGNDSFVFQVTDGGGATSTATVAIAVTPVNDAPVAVDQDLGTDEDTALNFSLVAGDVDGDTVTFSAPVTGPTDGEVSCLGAACTYTPHENFNGTDTFTFTADDGTGNPNSIDTGTITITVDPVNDAPEAQAHAVTLDEDTPTPITLPASDVDLDPLTFAITDGPDNGSATTPVGDQTTYTPNADFFGGDQFEFEAADAEFADTAIVVLTVNPVNDAPTLTPQSFSTDEDTPTVLSIAASDIDGDELAYSVSLDPQHGQLVGDLPDIGYLPDADYHGTDTFTVAVSDGNGGVTDAVMTIVVAPINDAPVASPVTATTDEDTAVGLLLAGADVDGDTVTYAVTDSTDHGTLDCTGDACTYTPNDDFHGSDLAIFEVTDGTATDSASVSITVSSVNDAPVTGLIVVTTSEDTPASVTLSATDPDGDLLTYEVATDPGNGTLDGAAPSLVYTPNPNFFSSDGFTFTASDGTATTSGAVTITVLPVNDAPIAADVSVSTDEDTAVEFDLSATDVESDTLTFTADSAPVGTLDCVAEHCTYTPPTDFAGIVSISYEAFDVSDSDTGLITIAVAQVNDPPTADDSTATTDEDTPVGITLTATDPDGDPLTYSVVSGPSAGTLTGDAPDLVYTPAANFFGGDSFTWQVADGNGGSVIQVVEITVAPVNDAPVALPQAVGADEDTPEVLTLLAEDAESDLLTFAVTSGPSHGMLSCSPTGACTYTPAANYNGSDAFEFSVTDPAGASSTATVTISVAGAPLLGTRLVAEPVLLTLGPVFRARLTVVGTNAPLAGRTVRFTAGGSLRCQAVTNANGQAQCGAPLLDLVAVLNLGYDASFAGDFDHAATTGRGVLLRLTLNLF